MNYEIYTTEQGEKRVKFENGRTHCINQDKNGYEYFSIINTKEDNKLGLFSGRIKDAVECIREGEGDCLEVINLFGKSEHVIRFLDRKYGENLRQQSIEGWKDTEFGYSLKFGYKNSFNGSYFIKNDKTILSLWCDNPNEYIYFKTKDEAVKYKNDIINEANRFADKYNIVRLNNKNNEDKIQKWINKNYNLGKVSSRIGLDLTDSYDNENDSKWYLEIVQVVKPSEVVKM
jgi:hypothetical protein